MNPEKIIEKIRQKSLLYLKSYPNIKTLVIGVSGGLDSATNCFVLRPVCDELGIKLIGRYIHIESNGPEEKQRASEIGKLYCHDFKSIDLTHLYKVSLLDYEENSISENKKELKIRRGNIKARMRMIYLYNLAQENKGIVVDNDNKTEHELGFWTLNGDVGDFTPLADLWKSEIYDIAKWFIKNNQCYEWFDSSKKELAYKACVEAVPTDGLGITSSDLEQFGAESYYQVDEILKEKDKFLFHLLGLKKIIKKHGLNVAQSVLSRHLTSNFKRNHPYKIKLS